MARKNRKHCPKAAAFVLPESLEGRTLFSAGPLPALTDLQNPNDTVVQFRTLLGTVNVEMFDSAAPNSVAAFLSRVGRGDIDLSFFDKANGDKSLEVGRYKFQAGPGLYTIPDPAPIALEGTLHNDARTVALSRDGSGSSTSQFFFNLKDNNNLNTGATRTAVIGRVADDASWNVVKAIAKLKTKDLDVPLTGVQGHTFDKVPVIDDHIDDHSAAADVAAALFTLTDAEVVKAAGSTQFYSQSIAYPEGFSGATVDEFLPIANPNDHAVGYQVILHFEFDPAHPFAKRDAVVATGTIGANSRGGATIWQGATDFPASTPDSLITPGRPYAIEVRSTDPVAATLSHYDFGSATGEDLTKSASTDWSLEGGVKGGDNHDFLVWFNPGLQAAATTTGAHHGSVDMDPSEVPPHGSVDIDPTELQANITLTFYPEGQPALAPITVSTEAFRRGGFSIKDLAALPNGRFSVRLQSDVPIVAALSHYMTGAVSQGSTTIGASGGTSSNGVMPIASFGPTAAAGAPMLTFLNPGDGASVPTLGAAGQYAIFAVNSAKINFKDPTTTVNGNAADQGAHGTVHFDHGGIINGHLSISTGVTVQSGGTVTGGTSVTDLSGPLGDANAASALAAGDAPTQTFDKVDNNTGTITGNGGLNVVKVNKDIKLDGGHSLTLSGSASDIFIINVYGKLDMKQASSILLAGGVTASNVLLNFVGNGGDIKIVDGCTVSGTILAPSSSFDMHGGHLTGAVIAGKDKLEMEDGLIIDAAPFNGDPAVNSASVDVTLHFENPAIADVVLPGAITVPQGRSVSVRLDTILPDVTPYLGQRFTVTYHSSRPVFAGASQMDAFDGTSTGVATSASAHSAVGEGFMDPARAGTQVFETVAVYNPGSSATNVSIQLLYTDGHVLTINRTVAAGKTAFVDLHTLPEVLAEGTDNHRYFYSVEVDADAPVVSEFVHLDTNLGRSGNQAGGFSTLATVLGDSVRIDTL